MVTSKHKLFLTKNATKNKLQSLTVNIRWRQWHLRYEFRFQSFMCFWKQEIRELAPSVDTSPPIHNNPETQFVKANKNKNSKWRKRTQAKVWRLLATTAKIATRMVLEFCHNNRWVLSLAHQQKTRWETRTPISPFIYFTTIRKDRWDIPTSKNQFIKERKKKN